MTELLNAYDPNLCIWCSSIRDATGCPKANCPGKNPDNNLSKFVGAGAMRPTTNPNPCSYCGQEVGTSGCPNALCSSKLGLGQPNPWVPPISTMVPIGLVEIELATWKHRYSELLMDNELQYELKRELQAEVNHLKKELASHSLGELKREIDELKQWKRRHDETHDKLVASSINDPNSSISKSINRNINVERRRI